MRILYAGDSQAGGPANYLLAVLNFLKADYVHLPPGKKLAPHFLKRPFDVIILSDFSRKDLPAVSERKISEQAEKGTGLLMVGGWGSFSGPFGGWKGSKIEKLLPVSCLGRDDRMNFPGGAWIHKEKNHPALRGLSFRNPPVICGMNRVRPKRNSRVILTAVKIPPPSKFVGAALRGRPFAVPGAHIGAPLLILHSNLRTAALATDLAPHWCGGWVDWGSRRLKLKVKGRIGVEVGDAYVRFVSNLIRWLANVHK